MKTIRVTVAGASGRMGQTLIRALAKSQDMRLAFALERPDHAALGRDAATLAGLPPADVPLTDDLVTRGRPVGRDPRFHHAGVQRRVGRDSRHRRASSMSSAPRGLPMPISRALRPQPAMR